MRGMIAKIRKGPSPEQVEERLPLSEWGTF